MAKAKEFSVSITHVVQPAQYHSLRIESTATFEVRKNLNEERDEAFEELDAFVTKAMKRSIKQWEKKYGSSK